MKVDALLFRFFIIWYVCGVVLLSFDLLPPWLEWANAVFLITAGILAVRYFIHKFGSTYGLLISTVIFFFSYFIEYLGSTHGILFGDYHYTDQFAPNVFGVPLAIGFAWLMVMGTSHVLALRIFPNDRLLYAVTGGLIAVVIDLIIDPVAYKVKEYWIWEEPGLYYDIPGSNFIGWFIVAFTLHILILAGSKFEKTPVVNRDWDRRMVILFILIISMFILLGLLDGLWLAGALTAACSLVILMMDRKGGRS
ncbi:carotenoid biosynthesis protein [Rossellomorea aquimaris]|uniref:carotenoid biosynthesis protein n=1 Tax=Rossellomorea aquimaris TaxID=189382 RepID=UPI001CD6620A|nr:carotenoid biosynthesis protein [Rossellomorea aquimaris]MCA1054984.1 carotenoid biosynthesis protein [Rossellomorea aquimaris]